MDAWPTRLGYSPPIARLRAKTAAVLLAAVAALAAVAGGLAGARGAPKPLPVTARLGTGERFELLATNHVHARLRLRKRRSARVRVAPVLRATGGATTALGPSRSVGLRRGRWTALSLPLSSGGRSALEQCPAGRVGVTITNKRLGAPRTVTRRLRLEAPACSRFFGPRAVWNTPLPDDAPLDPNSDAVTKQLLKLVDASARSDAPPTINTTDYTPPIYTVPASQPRVRVHLDRGPESSPALAEAFASVPLPPDAVPAPGTDSELVVWQPATDTLWEFWRLRRAHGRWYATYGGRMDHVSSSPGHYTEPYPRWGASGSSLSLAGGTITPRELRRGEIDHALSMAIPRARAGVFSLPAQRTDGESACADAVPEGARFRLDPALNVDALGLPPAIATMARAAQRYGIYVRDEAGAVVFYAQSTVSLPFDPYPALFGGRRAYELLRSFPWSHLKLTRMDLRSMPGYQPPLLGPGVLYGC